MQKTQDEKIELLKHLVSEMYDADIEKFLLSLNRLDYDRIRRISSYLTHRRYAQVKKNERDIYNTRY